MTAGISQDFSSDGKVLCFAWWGTGNYCECEQTLETTMRFEHKYSVHSPLASVPAAEMELLEGLKMNVVECGVSWSNTFKLIENSLFTLDHIAGSARNSTAIGSC